MRVLVVTGASGGHIFPALAFLDVLTQRYPAVKTLLVLPEKNTVRDTGHLPYEVGFVSIVAIERRLTAANLRALFSFLKGAWQSVWIVLKFKPDIVVGFGSIASIPAVAAAWFLRRKTVLHEQNVIPGKANRLLAKFCDTIAVSFVRTKDYLAIDPSRIVVTGNPLRTSLRRIAKGEALQFFALDKDKFTVLVMGGSRGSSSINRIFPEALERMRHREMLQVIHLAGSNDAERLAAAYKGLNVLARIFDFLREMEYAFSCADLAVCRAGATTIQELISYSLPAILIPYPFAYDHQRANAAVVADTGCGILFNEQTLDAPQLGAQLSRLMEQSQIVESMRMRYSSLKLPDAGVRLVQAVMGT